MTFSSDRQRKAMFANIFSKRGKSNLEMFTDEQGRLRVSSDTGYAVVRERVIAEKERRGGSDFSRKKGLSGRLMIDMSDAEYNKLIVLRSRAFDKSLDSEVRNIAKHELSDYSKRFDDRDFEVIED